MKYVLLLMENLDALFHEETAQHAQAAEHWNRALELGGSDGERRFLERRRDAARARA